MPLFNKKEKLTDYYFIKRIFGQGTCRLDHLEQREDHGSSIEKPEKKQIYAVASIVEYWQSAKQACFG